MSTKHVRTTGDLARFKLGLKVDCAACGAARTLDGFAAVKVGGLCPLADLQRRLRCDRCGEKAARLTVLTPPPR